MAHDPSTLPTDLPVPRNDGAADHLLGAAVPELELPATTGGTLRVDRPPAGASRLVLYAYSRTAQPGAEPLRADWDQIPGARGCTPQACAFRDHARQLAELGAAVAGISTQHTGYQAEVAQRLSLGFPLLSDAELRLATALRLPIFEVAGQTLLRRLTMIVRDGRIEHVWYPVFPPDRHAEQVLDWLRTVVWPAWATERVTLVDSDPSWPARGTALAAELNEVLSPWLVTAVEHVGSTAVPGLPAKPMLDLMAAVPDPDALVRDGVARLNAVDWVFVPPELDARPWRRFFVRPDARGVRRLAHLHVMRPDEPRWAQALVFRDRLRADRELAQRYAELKTTLAREHADDRERYTEAKREFIEAVLERSDGIERGAAIQNCRTPPASLVHAEPDGGQVVDELPRTLNYASARRLLEQYGWTRERGGKHQIKMTKPGHRPITLPINKRQDNPVGLSQAILRQAGLKNGRQG